MMPVTWFRERASIASNMHQAVHKSAGGSESAQICLGVMIVAAAVVVPAGIVADIGTWKTVHEIAGRLNY